MQRDKGTTPPDRVRGIEEEGFPVVESLCVAVDERHLAETKRLQAMLDDYNQQGWALIAQIGTSLVFTRALAIGIEAKMPVGGISRDDA